ncbi:hypothetical protein FB451DRAFT_1208699 [Mycena latifolia]|nr:hypothetical protein FB451DRAFT_1208699 [Mycena latifolia]
MEFHQLGGFDAGIYSFGKNPLGQQVYEPLQLHQNRDDRRTTSIELVLGITPSGTSHLLLTKDERDILKQYVTRLEGVDWDNFNRRRFFSRTDQERAQDDLRRRLLYWKEKARSPVEFESLSPIVFQNLPELEAKLEALQPKRKVAGKRKKDDDRDTSPLNRPFVGGHHIERSQFENARVFYRLLHGQINTWKFDLGNTSSWTSTIQVFSFCYNVWSRDGRPLQERRRIPRVLDIGWCEAPTPTLTGEMTVSHHIIAEANQLLENSEGQENPGNLQNSAQQPWKRLPYEFGETHGVTKILDNQTLAERVRDFFGKYTECTTKPVVLLVHNKEAAMDVFKSFGVDVSKWDFDLKQLLRPERFIPRQAANDPRRRPGDSRGRSASPRPHDRSRRDSPPRRSYAPVYVVDVQSMFIALLGTTTNSESVPSICKRLALFDKKGWCAGNECWMLVEVFRSMAQGAAIDDQKRDWPDLRAPVPLGPDEEQSEYEGSDSE